MQTAQPMGQPHHNQGLFSDHYLNVTLPARPDWNALAEEAHWAMQEIADLFEAYTPSENEAQVEEDHIASPTDETRDEAEEAVERLNSLTRSEQEARRDTLDWLRVEFGVEKPGQKLTDFAALGPDSFVEEVCKRRPKGERRLTPGALRDLKSGYTEMAGPVQGANTEARDLERRLSDLVNEAYGLRPEEVDLLWKTAPPRMPLFA